MRKLIAAIAVALGALLAMPAMAADFPVYPDYPDYPTYDVPDLPPVDYGLGGSFYLRGSAAGNLLTAIEARYGCVCVTTFDQYGFGYSVGAGAGYEFGDGFRADFTVDYLSNDGLRDTNGYELSLRSTLGMANVYYDFNFNSLHGKGNASGGFGAYVGAGLGFGYNQVSASGCACGTSGQSVEAAAAAMAGVTYDMGSVVADLGYRLIYMNKITNATFDPFYINHAMTHELRGTIRYRFN